MFTRRRVQAGATVNLGGLLAVTDIGVVAQPALIPTRILTYSWQWGFGKDDPLRFTEKVFSASAIRFNPFNVELVVVFVDRQVHRAADPR